MGHEVAAVLYLNSQLKVIRYMEMSHGTLTQASVYPREIVKTALRLDAAAIIMSHNHPSGVPEPSEADLALTRHLKHALALVDVRLLDHIIVTGQNTTSLAERGQVSTWSRAGERQHRSEGRRVGTGCVSTGQ